MSKNTKNAVNKGSPDWYNKILYYKLDMPNAFQLKWVFIQASSFEANILDCQFSSFYKQSDFWPLSLKSTWFIFLFIYFSHFTNNYLHTFWLSAALASFFLQLFKYQIYYDILKLLHLTDRS